MKAHFKHLFRKSVHFLYHLFLEKFHLIFEREKGRREFIRSEPPLVKLIHCNGVRFAMFIQSHGVIEDHILRFGDWSGDLLAVTDHFIRENSVIIEVGANIGFESLYYAKKYPGCTIYSYEPGTYAFDCLTRSRAYNQLSNLKIFKLGAGEKCETLQISSPSETSRNKGLGSIGKNFDLDESYVIEEVEIVTLDDHIPREKQVSLLKIDTQGHEFNVLRGATDLIRVNRPAILLEHQDEYHPDPRTARNILHAFFQEMSYDLYRADGPVLSSLPLSALDYFHDDIFALPQRMA